jgi:hypothetical protein
MVFWHTHLFAGGAAKDNESEKIPTSNYSMEVTGPLMVAPYY